MGWVGVRGTRRITDLRIINGFIYVSALERLDCAELGRLFTFSSFKLPLFERAVIENCKGSVINGRFTYYSQFHF